MIHMREATGLDVDAIRRVNRSAFPADEADRIADLAAELLAEIGPPPTLTLVAEDADGVAAHVAFSPVFHGEEGEVPGFVLAPLSVRPDRQRQGVGSRLVRHGLLTLRDRGVRWILVYGDPSYYGRFGFLPDAEPRFVPPHPLEQPHGWQTLALDGCPPPEVPVHFRVVAALDDPALW